MSISPKRRRAAVWRRRWRACGAELGKSYPLVIGGERIERDKKTISRNPAKLSQIVGEVSDATEEDADHAVQVATEAFKTWSRTPAEVRARYLVKVAAILRRRIYEFSAWMVYESSKNWLEAYADAAEAIDFLEFYAREAVRWETPHPTTFFAGEENEVRYLPLGVGVVISPWNFPLAIMAGMTVAAVGDGQHRHRQAGGADACHRRPVLRDPGIGGLSARRHQLPARSRRDRRRDG